MRRGDPRATPGRSCLSRCFTRGGWSDSLPRSFARWHGLSGLARVSARSGLSEPLTTSTRINASPGESLSRTFVTTALRGGSSSMVAPRCGQSGTSSRASCLPSSWMSVQVSGSGVRVNSSLHGLPPFESRCVQASKFRDAVYAEGVHRGSCREHCRPRGLWAPSSLYLADGLGLT